MSKIAINQMTFYYTDFYHPIFEQVNLCLDTEWKLGLIGRNGRGKSTFFRLLEGKLTPVSGTISKTVNMEYFPYEADSHFRMTMDVIKENVGGVRSMELAMEEIIGGAIEERFSEYSELLERYTELGGFELEGKIKKETAHIGLDEELLYRDYETLSGGEKTRMNIIALFLRKNRFVLLDEPTNHLDLEGKAELAEYLRRKKGFIVVSHDRDFLDTVIDHVMAINKTDIEVEQGNYSSWKRNTEQKEQFEFRTRERLLREIGELERRSEQTRGWAGKANTQKYPYRTDARTNGSQAYMRQAKRAEEHIMDNLEEKKMLLRNFETAQELVLPAQQETGEGWLIRTQDLSYTYPGSSTPVIAGLNLNLEPGERLWIRGRNGAGKSTLLKLLAGALRPDEGGTKEALQRAEDIVISVSGQEAFWKSGYLEEKFELPEQKEQFEQFLEFCRCFDLPEGFEERPLETYSSGELKKADIARALSEPNQVLFLDEPLNYMDIYFREQLEQAILACKPTLVFVEHEECFGRKVATRTINMV